LGLAPNLVLMIFELIQSINKQGTTILLIEQNANMALSISHTAYVLETGNITMSGNAADLANDPRIIKAYLGIG
jgi:branched-chain amino acid transport system ATP-binding protein